MPTCLYLAGETREGKSRKYVYWGFANTCMFVQGLNFVLFYGFKSESYQDPLAQYEINKVIRQR